MDFKGALCKFETLSSLASSPTQSIGCLLGHRSQLEHLLQGVTMAMIHTLQLCCLLIVFMLHARWSVTALSRIKFAKLGGITCQGEN